MFGEIAARYDCLNRLLRWVSISTGVADGEKSAAARHRSDPRPVHRHRRPGLGLLSGRRAANAGRRRRLLPSHARHWPRQSRPGRRASIAFVEADAAATPVSRQSFSDRLGRFGLRNVTDTDRGLARCFASAAPAGGSRCSSSRCHLAPFRAVYGWYFRHVLPRIGQRCARMRRTPITICQPASASFPAAKRWPSASAAGGLPSALLSADVRHRHLIRGDEMTGARISFSASPARAGRFMPCACWKCCWPPASDVHLSISPSARWFCGKSWDYRRPQSLRSRRPALDAAERLPPAAPARDGRGARTARGLQPMAAGRGHLSSLPGPDGSDRQRLLSHRRHGDLPLLGRNVGSGRAWHRAEPDPSRRRGAFEGARKLILVPRETPLSTVQLDNMRAPPKPERRAARLAGLLSRRTSIRDLVDFVVAPHLRPTGNR